MGQLAATEGQARLRVKDWVFGEPSGGTTEAAESGPQGGSAESSVTGHIPAVLPFEAHSGTPLPGRAPQTSIHQGPSLAKDHQALQGLGGGGRWGQRFRDGAFQRSTPQNELLQVTVIKISSDVTLEPPILWEEGHAWEWPPARHVEVVSGLRLGYRD